MTSTSIIHPIWAFAALLLFVVSCSAADWPQFQRDATKSGLTGDDVPADPAIVWSADLQSINVQPIICSATVYVLGGNGTLWALDEATGEAVWKSQMDGWSFQTSPPACDGERIYAASDSGDLAAFYARTGQMIWTHHLTDKRFEGPVTYADGRIYLGESIAYGKGLKRYFSFDPDGNECWNVTRETSGYLWDGACVASGFMFWGDNDGMLVSVNRTDGTIVDVLDLKDKSRIGFAKEDAGRIRSSASFRDGYIYTSSEFSQEIGYAWKIGFNETTGRFEDDGWGTAVGFSTSTPVVYNGRVYLGVGEHGQPGALACLDDSSGDMIWSYPVEAGVKSSPSISTAGRMPRILFTTAQVNGSVYCLEDSGDAAKLLWKLNPPDHGYLLGGVSISEGRVYFGTEGDKHSGKLYCLGDAVGWPQFHLDPASLWTSTRGRFSGMRPSSLTHTAHGLPRPMTRAGSSSRTTEHSALMPQTDARSGGLLHPRTCQRSTAVQSWPGDG